MSTYTLIEIRETGEQIMWKDCEIAGCPHGICYGRSDRFCYPHSKGDMTLDQILELGKETEDA